MIVSSGRRGAPNLGFARGGGNVEPVDGGRDSIRKRGEDGLTV